MMRYVLPSLVLAGFLGVGLVHAQGTDPTRPSDALTTPDPGNRTAPAETGVQTVILRPGGKSTAVINGQSVAVGGKFGGKRVLKITESEIVLKGEDGREVMKVTPSIEKTPAKKTAAKAQRTTGTAQQ
jgi:hypothetical protein